MRSESGRKPLVLVFLRYYLPGHKGGGPVRSIANMALALGDAIDFHIVTSDRDVGDREPYPGIAVNRWTRVGAATVFYCEGRQLTLPLVARLIRDVGPDVVYLNSFFSPTYSMAPLLARRLGLVAPRIGWILAPRGEFSAGALAIKPLRKRFFLGAAAAIGLHRGVLWQATSSGEARDIVRSCGVAPGLVRVVPNLAASQAAYERPSGLDCAGSPLEVCFLSRVTPKKNLWFAIDVLARVQRPVDFHVYGPLEDDAYVAECKAAAADSTLRVHWHGDIPHEAVRGCLAKHQLFFLPTRGENFGHVILEALSAGLPVVISDQTPWLDLEIHNAGWVLPLSDPDAFVKVIERYADLPLATRARASRSAHEYAATVCREGGATKATEDLLLAAVTNALRT